MLWLLICCCALQIFDGVQTHLGIQFGLKEQNPLQLWLFAKVGSVWALTLTKGFGCALAAGCWGTMHPHALRGLLWLYIAVVSLPLVSALLAIHT